MYKLYSLINVKQEIKHHLNYLPVMRDAMMSGKIINFRSLIKSSPGYAMYDICTESSSYFLRRSPTMTPRLTPVKVMTSNMFLFNHAMNRSIDTFFISGFILNFPGSVKLIQVQI